MSSGKREPRSPWQRYGKKKWMYSTTYQLWREAVKVHGAMSEKAIALSCQHAKTMSVKNSACVTA